MESQKVHIRDLVKIMLVTLQIIIRSIYPGWYLKYTVLGAPSPGLV